MARSQAARTDIQTYKIAVNIISTIVDEREPYLLCDTSTGRPRLIVSPDFRRPVFEAIHNFSLTGVNANVKLVLESFFSFGMACENKSVDGPKNTVEVV